MFSTSYHMFDLKIKIDVSILTHDIAFSLKSDLMLNRDDFSVIWSCFSLKSYYLEIRGCSFRAQMFSGGGGSENCARPTRVRLFSVETWHVLKCCECISLTHFTSSFSIQSRFSLTTRAWKLRYRSTFDCLKTHVDQWDLSLWLAYVRQNPRSS